MEAGKRIAKVAELEPSARVHNNMEATAPPKPLLLYSSTVTVGGTELTGLRRGAWTPEEDVLLKKCVEEHGEGRWHMVPARAGLRRCRKSCRLRWLNYLKPNIKRGPFSAEEVDLILRLHRLLGNKWSLIAGRIPGRTANDIKNYWNSCLVKTVAEPTMREQRLPVGMKSGTTIGASLGRYHSALFDNNKSSSSAMKINDARGLTALDHYPPTLVIKPRPMTVSKTFCSFQRMIDSSSSPEKSQQRMKRPSVYLDVEKPTISDFGDKYSTSWWRHLLDPDGEADGDLCQDRPKRHRHELEEDEQQQQQQPQRPLDVFISPDNTIFQQMQGQPPHSDIIIPSEESIIPSCDDEQLIGISRWTEEILVEGDWDQMVISWMNT